MEQIIPNQRDCQVAHNTNAAAELQKIMSMSQAAFE